MTDTDDRRVLRRHRSPVHSSAFNGSLGVVSLDGGNGEVSFNGVLSGVIRRTTPILAVLSSSNPVDLGAGSDYQGALTPDFSPWSVLGLNVLVNEEGVMSLSPLCMA